MYPKIQTLWKRDIEHNCIIIRGNYSRDEFKNIQWFHITEKIDGMNIRIIYKNSQDGWKPMINFFGRTDKAILPKELSQYLEVVFSEDVLNWCFPNAKYVCLFGEGYGYKIQKGGQQYNPNQEFVLFDVFVDGWWLKQDTVTEIAEFFGIPRVPVLGVWTKEYAEDFVNPSVKNYAHPFKTIDNIPLSILSIEPREMEGIMCRSEPLMLFRNKSPIQFKLKVKDYKELYNE
jgi:hypothetical protein